MSVLSVLDWRFILERILVFTDPTSGSLHSESPTQGNSFCQFSASILGTVVRVPATWDTRFQNILLRDQSDLAKKRNNSNKQHITKKWNYVSLWTDILHFGSNVNTFTRRCWSTSYSVSLSCLGGGYPISRLIGTSGSCINLFSVPWCSRGTMRTALRCGWSQYQPWTGTHRPTGPTWMGRSSQRLYWGLSWA